MSAKKNIRSCNIKSFKPVTLFFFICTCLQFIIPSAFGDRKVVIKTSKNKKTYVFTNHLKVKERGWHSSVFHGHLEGETSKKVVVKVPLIDGFEQIKKEHKILSRLSHPNIVRPIGLGTIVGDRLDAPALVMDLAPGEQFDLNFWKDKSLDEISDITKRILHVLKYVENSGWSHRDVYGPVSYTHLTLPTTPYV